MHEPSSVTKLLRQLFLFSLFRDEVYYGALLSPACEWISIEPILCAIRIVSITSYQYMTVGRLPEI